LTDGEVSLQFPFKIKTCRERLLPLGRRGLFPTKELIKEGPLHVPEGDLGQEQGRRTCVSEIGKESWPSRTRGAGRRGRRPSGSAIPFTREGGRHIKREEEKRYIWRALACALYQ